MFRTATASEDTLRLQTVLDAYQSDFALMPPCLEQDAYELVESDLQAIRCLVTYATPDVKERWRSLVHAHILLTDAMLKNSLATATAHSQPVSEPEIVRLRDSHAAAVSALRAVQ